MKISRYQPPPLPLPQPVFRLDMNSTEVKQLDAILSWYRPATEDMTNFITGLRGQIAGVLPK